MLRDAIKKTSRQSFCFPPIDLLTILYSLPRLLAGPSSQEVVFKDFFYLGLATETASHQAAAEIAFPVCALINFAKLEHLRKNFWRTPDDLGRASQGMDGGRG